MQALATMQLPRAAQDLIPLCPTYSGTTCPEEFISQFHQQCRQMGVAAHQLPIQFALKLQGSARAWFDLQPETSSLDDLILGLRTRYGEPFPESTLYARLFQLQGTDPEDGRARETKLQQALQACERMSIPFAPGPHELQCCWLMQIGRAHV